MLLRVLTFTVTVFWLVMMVALTKREILPVWQAAREAAQTPTYAQLEAMADKPRLSQMGIFLGARRIGFTRGTVRKGEDGLRLTNETHLNLNLSGAEALTGGIGGNINLVMLFKARVSEGQLVEFRVTVHSPPATDPIAIIDGYPVDNHLMLSINQGGQKSSQSIPFDPRQVLSNDLAPSFTPSRLRVGEKWAVRSIDPMNYRVRTAWATVSGRETIEVDARPVEAFLITIPYGAQEVRVWTDSSGQVLKQKIFGFTFIRETPTVEPNP